VRAEKVGLSVCLGWTVEVGFRAADTGLDVYKEWTNCQDQGTIEANVRFGERMGGRVIRRKDRKALVDWKKKR
jgi:hypothetical protein